MKTFEEEPTQEDTTKQFVFLYPIKEIIDFEIKNHSWAEEGGIEVFRQKYKEILNSCIDARYRQKGFKINYAVFDESPVSDVIDFQPSDRIVGVGLDFETHTTKQANGEYPYPDQDYILNQFNGVKVLRIAGFHMWDCVERLAKRAYEKELEVLVDEDLTEFLPGRIRFDPEFRIDRFPTYNPLKKGEGHFRRFMEARQNKPWLWQKY